MMPDDPEQLMAFMRGETNDPGVVRAVRGGIQWPVPKEPKEIRPSQRGVIDEPFTDGGPFSWLRLPDGTACHDGREFIARYAVQRYGWLNDERDAPQSNSAQALAQQVYERYPAIRSDDHTMIVDLIHLVGLSIGDPHDVDFIGMALDLLDYIRRTR